MAKKSADSSGARMVQGENAMVYLVLSYLVITFQHNESYWNELSSWYAKLYASSILLVMIALHLHHSPSTEQAMTQDKRPSTTPKKTKEVLNSKWAAWS